VIVPSGSKGNIVQIQVTNNGTASNIINEYVYKASPGLFTNPSDGVSVGAIEHADGSLISETNPVVPGETIQVYMTGLGAVSPAVADGAAAGSSPLSQVTGQFAAFIGWARGTITFAGLVPTLAGLYQLNVQIPSVVPTGDQLFEIDGPDSASTQGIIPVMSGTTNQKPPTPQIAGPRHRMR
jgi:uncharacterized protein (TIGR03437 family)